MSAFSIPAIVRGELIEKPCVPYPAAGGAPAFDAVDPGAILERLPLGKPGTMQELQSVPLEEILEILAETGRHLGNAGRRHLEAACAAGVAVGGYPASLLRQSFAALPAIFAKETVREIAAQRVGLDYLDGWVEQKLSDGRRLRIRAFGARCLHIPAGNGGLISAITIIRNAITRGDAIVKIPSNDPLTAIAIARCLLEVAPGHPLTRHLSVAYWRGGDAALEEPLIRPQNLEKICAWGGFASIKHIAGYLQPGLELVALDPKRSATILGPEAFRDEETMREVATRTACDIGMANQEACASARVIYAMSGTDAEGVAQLERLGQAIYEAMVTLPPHLSTPPTRVDRELRDHLEASRMIGDWYHVIGGEEDEGAIIVSRLDEPVDYAPLLSGRVANLVPVDSLERATRAMNSWTQTVGIYPESLKRELRDVLPLHGAQRLTSLGYACHVTSAAPQDAIEPVRRLCKWVVEEECDPAEVFPPWKAPPLGGE